MAGFFRFLEWVGAAALFAVMSLTVVDVVGRYFLNSPLPGSIELTRVGIAIVVFCALPSLTARRGHVSVDLFESRLPPAMVRASERVFLVLFAVGLAVLGWRMYLLGVRSADRGAFTEYLHIPFSVIEYFMALMSWVTAVSALVHAFLPVGGKMKMEQVD